MSKAARLPPYFQVAGLLTYDPATGELHWRKPGPGRRPDLVAGYRQPDGRKWVCVNGTRYAATRIAHLLMTRRDPGSLQIDHINGDPSDDRWVNLRAVTLSENRINCKTTSITGHKGIYRGADYADGRPRYLVQICRTLGRGPVGAKGSRDGFVRKTHNIGSFSDLAEAKAAYIEAVYDFGAEDFTRPAALTSIKPDKAAPTLIQQDA